MVSVVAKAEVAKEELEMLLNYESLKELEKILDRLCIVIILRTLHSDFNPGHYEQLLTGHEFPSTDSLITKLLHITTKVKIEN